MRNRRIVAPSTRRPLALLVNDISEDDGTKEAVAIKPTNKLRSILGITPTVRIGLHQQHGLLHDGSEFWQFSRLAGNGSDSLNLLLGSNGVIDVVAAGLAGAHACFSAAFSSSAIICSRVVSR